MPSGDVYFGEVMPVELLMSATPIFLFGVGLLYLVRLRGFYLFHPLRCLGLLLSGRRQGGISPFRALTVALAGTLGVGNIVGVASALCLGGPGAVLWMLFSALVAMVLKYAEITLALRHSRIRGERCPVGGAPYYIEDGMRGLGHPRWGRLLGVMFALLCLVNALSMGGLLQIHAVASAMEESFGLPRPVTGMAVALLAAVVARGGARGISTLTQRLVPLMTVGFLLVCLAVLIQRRALIPEALTSIFEDALHPQRAGAGLLGYLTSGCVRYGVMRGLVSNEAGCGTAPMAHVAADTDHAARQGLFGLVEVFVDTVLLCTVTALCILVGVGEGLSPGDEPTHVARAAWVSVLGEWAGGVFSLAILLFGVATVMCWTHYGMTCVGYLTVKRRPQTLLKGGFVVAFSGSIVVGAVITPTVAWTLADAAIGCMTILNLGMLTLLLPEVREETEQLFSRVSFGRWCISCRKDRSERSQP